MVQKFQILKSMCSTVLTVLAIALHTTVSAETGEPILLGMSNSQTGQSAYLGKAALEGVTIRLEEENRKGGINGRQLKLIALDDGYEPERTAPNMRELINRKNVAAIIGNVGAPCAVVAAPIAQQLRVLLWGYITGGAALRRNPPDRYVYNYRAGLKEEISELVTGFMQHRGIEPEAIAFFTQRDAYGDSAFEGGIEALQNAGFRDASRIVHARYERNTTEVKSALAEIMLASIPPKVVIIAAARAPAAEFIQLARKNGLKAEFGAPSFVDAFGLAAELGERADGIIVTQVVPPLDAPLPMAKAYHESRTLLGLSTAPSFISFEAYILTSIFLDILKTIDGPITRDSIVEAFEKRGAFDAGLGTTLRLDADHHQASNKVWLTNITRGHVRPYEWSK